MPNKIVSLFKSKQFRLALLLILFIAAALIILAMSLGNQTGSFVVRVQDGNVEKSIMVTENKDDSSSYKPTLTAKGMANMSDYSPYYFLQEDFQTLRELSAKPGFSSHDNGSLYIYTFYIMNTSASGGVGVNVKLNYSNVTNQLDEVIRVLTFYETYNVSAPNVYQKADDLEKLGLTSVEYDRYILQPTNFKTTNASNGIVFDDQSINIPYRNDDGSVGYVKYTIMFWIEGDDPDSNYYSRIDEQGNYHNLLYSGTIKFSLTVSIRMGE
jgi:hypothetical protein